MSEIFAIFVLAFVLTLFFGAILLILLNVIEVFEKIEHHLMNINCSIRNKK